MLNTGRGSGKTRLVADLTEEYRKLNAVLKETEKMSKGIGESLKGLTSGGGNGGASSMTSPSGPPAPPGPSGPSSGGGGGGKFSFGSAVASMAGAAVNALAAGVDPQNYITNDVTRRRFGFFAGGGNGAAGAMAGSTAFQTMQNKGTSNGPLDAANAAMAGASAGMMPGLKNYGTVMNSVAGVSNMLPGAGLEAGMGAVTALNQGASVNKLRMIGINVRDQNGYMRDIEDIARDLWKTLNSTKSGGSRNISEADLSYSLQPGMSVDMLLNQYFGSDAVLRQSIVAYLFQFAKNNGAKVGGGYTSSAGKANLSLTGANPSITQSIGTRNAAGYNNTNAFTNAGIKGITKANQDITAASNFTAGTADWSGGLVEGTTYAQTLAGAGNGAGGIMISGLLKATDILGSIGKTLGNLVSKIFPAAGGVAARGAGLAAGAAASEAIAVLTLLGGDAKKGNSSGPYSAPQAPGWNAGTGKVEGTATDGTEWSKKLLRKIKAPVNAKNLAAINKWMMQENGAVNGIGQTNSRNNPLNIISSYGEDATKSIFDGEESSVLTFATEQGGLNATAKQLLSNNKKGDQYYKILTDLQKGADPTKTWHDVARSPWAAGHYGSAGNDKVTYDHSTNVTITVTGTADAIATAQEVKRQIDAAAVQASITQSLGW